jgi:2-desacetyl-2-hydroxyethyl bacteriochlorophyllide A dehydrogenase
LSAVRFDAPHKLSLTATSDVPPQPDEVSIRVDLVGICATDVHIFHGEFPKAEFPLVPGHEFTGIIEALGSAVTDLEVGQRVVVDPAIFCGECRFCKRDRTNLCQNRRAYGINRAGGAQQLINVRKQNCYVISSSVPATDAVLAEPLACVVHAFDRVGSVRGLKTLILGAGAVGLLAVQVARHLGVASVDQIDLDPRRLAVAGSLGAARVAQSVSEFDGELWDLVIDATGVEPAIRAGLSVLDRGGVFLQIGVADPAARVEISPYEIFAKEISIIASLTTERSFFRAIAMLESKHVTGRGITGQPVPLADYETALGQSGKTPVAKIVVAPNLDSH